MPHSIAPLRIETMSQGSRSAQQPNVLFFSSYVSWESGASHALREIVKRVARNGIKPLVVIPECTDSFSMFPKKEFDVEYLKIERPRRTWNTLTQMKYLLAFPPTLYSLRQLIRTRGIHLVHFNEITDFIAGIAARGCGIPCVCHVRADGIPNPYRWLLVAMMKRITDAIIVPSESTAAWIIAEAAELAGRVRLIRDYAIDSSSFQQPVSGSEFRLNLGIPPAAILVVLVSKLVTPKGHECFIRAAEKVFQESREILFVVVGGPVPGHELEASEIKTLAEQLIPGPAFRFVGPRSDLCSIYSAADIVVHCPIYPDPYPTVVLYAMLLGKPVIGSDIGGIPEQIEHNKTGLLIAPDNPDALAAAVLRLARDPAKRESLGAAARKRTKQGWAPETHGQLLATLYAEVIERSRLHKNGGRQTTQIIEV